VPKAAKNKTRDTREVKSARFGWRSWLATLGWCAVFVSSAMAARKVHHFVITDPQFTLSPDRRDAITVEGMIYTPRAEVWRLFASDFGHSVFSVRLEERRRRLLAMDWVADASVSRVWPNRLLVHIVERQPVAFVNLPFRPGAGSPARVMLIDAEGVLLEPPFRARLAFPVLSGITDNLSQAERKRRVQAMLGLLSDLGPLSKNVSEVDATHPDNLCIVAQVEGRALELMLGDTNYQKRFQNFLNHYQEIQKRTGNGTAFDLRLDDRITAKE
jgi:cell division protein FtsQ